MRRIAGLREPAALAGWIGRRQSLRRLLVAVARHGPPGAWIGAGCLRNAVWDAAHGRRRWRAPADVDVVFCNPVRPDADDDRHWAERLVRHCPGIDWSVTNQARMAARHGHGAYRDVAAAIAHWPETATAVAARLHGGRVRVLAPHGLADLAALRLRPTPAFVGHPAVIVRRAAARGWRRRWPRLRAAPHRLA